MPRAFGTASAEEEKNKLIELAQFLSEGRIGRDLQQEYWMEFRSASPEARNDKDVVMAAVSMDGMLLRWASDEQCDDLEVVTTAVKKSPWVLQHASARVRASREAVLQTVQGHGRAVKFASDELRGDRDVIMAALRMDGHAFQHASEELRSDKDFVLEALQYHSCTLEYASEELQADRDVIMKALHRQASESCVQTNVLIHASPELQRDPEIVLEGVKYSGSGMGYAAMDLKRDKDFVLRAARVAPHGQAWNCYFEGHQAVKAISWDIFGSVVDSKLACRGESAPVLTISLTISMRPRKSQASTPSAIATSTTPQLQQPPANDTSCQMQKLKRSCLSCEAVLLSGASFRCLLEESSNDDDDGDGGEDHVGVAHDPKSDSGIDDRVGCALTLNDLAARMVREVHQRLEVEAPSRVFLIMTNAHDEFVAVTPWDRDRPLKEFIRPS
mmetsp:Transcript_15078/g.32470  ORF Transcript_15078/g.32470 Transcript_15078/m.32470 type:complete len:444 (-) Transcript_15078:127-1458(-)